MAAGAGDNAAAAVGTGTVGENSCNISVGTSGTVFITTNEFGVDEKILYILLPIQMVNII